MYAPSDLEILILTFVPILFFLIALFFLCSIWKKINKEIISAKSKIDKEAESSTISKPTSAYNSQIIELLKLYYNDELLVFVCGIVALGISTALISFSIYTYLVHGSYPNLEDCKYIFFILSIGIIPFVVKKLADAIK